MEDTLTLLLQGGWLMIPIGLCSLLAAAIIIERFAALRRRAIIDPAVVRAVEAYDGRGEPAEPLEMCRKSRSPYARIIEETIKARHLDRPQIIETMHAIGRTKVGGLQRGLTVLEIIAGISPLMGLLGTVLGMVSVFNAIAAEGIGDPQVLSSGISQALVTTVAGLSVAIPALAAHSWFNRQVEEFATEMQERATALIARFHQDGKDEDQHI